jgi:hypothetical protein
VRGRRKAHSFIAPCKRVKVQNNEFFSVEHDKCCLLGKKSFLKVLVGKWNHGNHYSKVNL